VDVLAEIDPTLVIAEGYDADPLTASGGPGGGSDLVFDALPPNGRHGCRAVRSWTAGQLPQWNASDDPNDIVPTTGASWGRAFGAWPTTTTRAHQQPGQSRPPTGAGG
jgi:hypothetical protein